MKSIRIGNDIRIVWPIVLSGDVSKLKDLDLTVEVRPSKKVVDTHNYADDIDNVDNDSSYIKSETTIMMNGGVVCRPDIGDGKEHCKQRPYPTRPIRPTDPVKLPYYIENNTLIAMWTADRQFAVGDYDIIVYAHKNGGGQAVADTYRFVRLVPHTAQADAPDNSGIEAVITMQPLTLCLSGLSAYEVAVVNGFQGSVEEWLESLKAGKLSSYVSVESIDNLPKQGDESTGYIIGTKLYIYVGTGGDTLEGKYKDVGEFRGPQGAPGSNGKSAYELAVEGGYEGSVEEWLLSLKGRDGVDGVNGADGLDGENGKDGVTPLIRWNNNRIEQSTDNGKSWWALSDKFNNKLYIKGYVTSADQLPKNALVGDMYGVGPIYGDDDVEQTKPYYQVYVNTVTDWAKSATITKVYQGDTELPQSAENNEIILIKKSTDNYLVYKYVNGSWNLLANLAEIYVEKDDIVNRGDNIFALVQSEIENQYELYERVVSWRNSGTFTSITAGIVNELGDSENAVMSQKAVTDAILNKIDLSAIDFDAQTIAKLALATIPTRYNVISSNKSVGIMEVFSDSIGHMVTEVFDTHYIVENGALTGGHSDDKTFRYMRSYHLVEGGTSDIPVGTWGEWKQIYSSDNAKDVETLKTDVDNLNANTGIDEYETFSDAKAYSVGDTVLYNGLLYTFTTDHAAGAWDESHVESSSLKKEMTNLFSLKINSIQVSPSSNNLFSKINTIKGYYITDDGIQIATDTAWLITKPIEIKEDIINFSNYRFTLPSARKFAIFAINGTFIRASSNEEETNNKYVRKNNNENFIVFGLNSRVSKSNFTISYKEITGEEKKSYGNENSDVLYNDLLNSIEDETLRLKNDVNTINIIDLNKCEFGKFINEHGIIADGNEYYCVSDYIYIKENDTICSNAVNTTPCSPYSVYDENKELIRTSGINNDNTYKYSQGDVYVRFCFYTRKQNPMANFGEVLYDCEYTIENPLKSIQNIFSTYTDKFKSVDYIKYDKKYINTVGVISNAVESSTWYLKVINAQKGKTYYITTLFENREYIDGWGFYGTLPLETDIIDGISVNNAVYANNDDISKNLLSIFHCNEDCLLVVSLSTSFNETAVYVKDIPSYIGIDSLLDKCYIIEYKDNVTEWESAEFTPDASKFVYIETIDKLGSCMVDIIGVNGNVLLGTIDIDDIKYFDPSYYAVYNKQSTFKLKFKGQFYASRIFILQYQNNIGFVGRLDSLESKINENSSSIEKLKIQENKYIIGSDGEKYKISIGDNKNIIAIPIIPLKAFYTGNSLMSGNGTNPRTGMNATENKYDWVHRISNYFQSKNSSFDFTCESSKAFETASSAEEQDEFLNNTLKPYLNSDLDLIIIQIGDNVSESNGSNMSEWANGCLKYCKFVREKAPNARVCWMFAWYHYNDAKVINPIIDACNKYGVEMIDIRGYGEIISNQSKIGEVVKANNPQSKTIVYDELNYNEQDKTLTIKFTLDEKQYTSVVPVESYEDNKAEKTVTWVGEWSVTTMKGIATHPSNEGFRVIANKILYVLGCEGENYFTK